MTTTVTAAFGPTLRWNGTSWKASPLASVGGSNRQLAGLSCGGPSNCAVTGTYQPAKGGPLRAFAEHWNGLAWKVTKLPQS